jgi:hypothetical protein
VAAARKLDNSDMAAPTLGFETIGNATVIIHDGVPLLATDPWIAGDAYFGSWAPSYETPSEQMDHILKCPYLWFSHGHPDHLNAVSVDRLADKTILLPDHVGGRIRRDLDALGLKTRVLPSGIWVPLSSRVSIMCLPDHNQDATLLIALGDCVIVNLNDGMARGWRSTLLRAVRPFRRRYLLALCGYGDADMLNFYDEDGRFIPPRAALRSPVGRQYNRLMRRFACTHAIPFSCFHRYQRADSIHCAVFETPVEAHVVGFDPKVGELLPPFVSVDAERDAVGPIEPAKTVIAARPPEDFGDDWSEPLDADEVRRASDYFRRKQHLARHIGYVRLRVGGKETVVSLDKSLHHRGVTFEAPRHSLMTAIDHAVFDDMLIGNFMKTTLHGLNSLYPDFTPYVAKYADNGQAESEAELRRYFAAYRRTDLGYVLEALNEASTDLFRSYVSPDSSLHAFARRVTGR